MAADEVNPCHAVAAGAEGAGQVITNVVGAAGLTCKNGLSLLRGKAVQQRTVGIAEPG